LITTTSGIVAGLKPSVPLIKSAFTGEAAGQWHNLGVVSGNPGPWTLGSPGMAGVAVVANALGGALRFDNPVTGEARLAKLMAALGANVAALMLFDLLWYQSGIAETTTGAQTINSVALPARDINGAVSGDGVEAWLHASTATGNGGAIGNTSISYTNQGGTAARTGNLVYSFPASAEVGTMVPFSLEGSDRGVRSIQTVSLGTSYVSGQVELLALRRIATVYGSGVFDWAALGFPRCHNDSAIYAAVLLTGTAAGALNAEANFAHG
jgi:hypothetical protein